MGTRTHVSSISPDKELPLSLSEDFSDSNSSNNDSQPSLSPGDKKPVKKYPYKEIVSHLNKILSTHYSHTNPITQRLIRARINEGFNKQDFFNVIEKKFKQWRGKDMQSNLKPSVLFGDHFESYVNEKTYLTEQEQKNMEWAKDD